MPFGRLNIMCKGVLSNGYILYRVHMLILNVNTFLLSSHMYIYGCVYLNFYRICMYSSESV